LARILGWVLVVLVILVVLMGLAIGGYVAYGGSIGMGFGAVDIGVSPREYDDNKMVALGLPFITDWDPAIGAYRCAEPNARRTDILGAQFLVQNCKRWSVKPPASPPTPVPTVPLPLPHITGVPATIPAAPVITVHPNVPPPTRDVSKPTER
jgi:hypothetical protein